jgi:hypothetical protein
VTHLRLVGALLAALILAPGIADTSITFQGNGLVPPAALYISGGKVRLETNGGSVPGWAIYDEAQRVLYVFDERRREYYRLDASSASQLARLGAYKEQALALLMEQARQLAPGQREIVENQLSRLGLSGDRPAGRRLAPRLVATRQHQTVIGIPCDVIRVQYGSESVGRACVADPGDVPISATDFRTLKSLAAFAREIAEPVSALSGAFSAAAWVYAADSLQGLPVAVTDLGSGARAQVTSVTHAPVAEDLFRLPTGYRRADLLGRFAGGG